MTNNGQDGFYDWPLDFRAFETFVAENFNSLCYINTEFILKKI